MNKEFSNDRPPIDPPPVDMTSADFPLGRILRAWQMLTESRPEENLTYELPSKEDCKFIRTFNAAQLRGLVVDILVRLYEVESE